MKENDSSITVYAKERIPAFHEDDLKRITTTGLHLQMPYSQINYDIFQKQNNKMISIVNQITNFLIKWEHGNCYRTTITVTSSQ